MLPLWQIFQDFFTYVFGQFSIVVNGQIFIKQSRRYAVTLLTMLQFYPLKMFLILKRRIFYCERTLHLHHGVRSGDQLCKIILPQLGNKSGTEVDVIKLFFCRKSGKSRFPLKPKKQE